jgi:hypothetical protein
MTRVGSQRHSAKKKYIYIYLFIYLLLVLYFMVYLTTLCETQVISHGSLGSCVKNVLKSL